MDNQKDQDYSTLINDAVHFLESMNRVYGTDRAHELWLGMKDVMGREVQLDVFNSMLKGDSGGRIRFRVIDPQTPEVVNTIKAIREYAGCGLKEAKDIWDLAKATGAWQTIEYDPYYNTSSETRSQFRHRMIRRFRELGHEVS